MKIYYENLSIQDINFGNKIPLALLTQKCNLIIRVPINTVNCYPFRFRIKRLQANEYSMEQDRTVLELGLGGIIKVT